MKENKTAIEFFAGIGLMRAGLELAGWKIVLANDIDATKKRLYLNHFSNSEDEFILDDIHNLIPEQIPTATLATASFPCTDLSLAGKREGLQGKQSSAFWGFVNILEGMGEKKPPLILLENVAGFLTSHNGKDFYDALIALNKLGYAVDAFLIDASHFVPQSRVRLFIVGKLKKTSDIRIRHSFPETILRPAKLRDFIFNNSDIHWSINHTLPNFPELQKN